MYCTDDKICMYYPNHISLYLKIITKEYEEREKVPSDGEKIIPSAFISDVHTDALYSDAYEPPFWRSSSCVPNSVIVYQEKPQSVSKDRSSLGWDWTSRSWPNLHLVPSSQSYLHGESSTDGGWWRLPSSHASHTGTATNSPRCRTPGFVREHQGMTSIH